MQVTGGLTLCKLESLLRTSWGALAGDVMKGTESLFLRTLFLDGGEFVCNDDFLGAVGGVLVTLVLEFSNIAKLLL